MSAKVWTEVIGGFKMSLRETAGPNYTLVCQLLHDPVQISITNLGNDRSYAMHIFARKVQCHRVLVGENTEASG